MGCIFYLPRILVEKCLLLIFLFFVVFVAKSCFVSFSHVLGEGMGFDSLLEILALGGGSIGGVIAAFKAVSEMRLNRIQRVIEHRWKQTGEAKDFIAAIKNSDLYKHF